ncbi:hypothetical protein [Tenacibaculum dicentrarchi]|uniref:hypothetical protein n=1 Tax=Tenacibaculum dicentrarchi TaxID=669041 RepID=UPI003514A716
MASSRRYGEQVITLVTTSRWSRWSVYEVGNRRRIKWHALGNIYEGASPVIDFRENRGSETITIKSSGVFECFKSSAHLLNIIALDISKCVDMECLNITSEEVKELDVSNNVNLFDLNLQWCSYLTIIYVNQTQLDILNGVTPQPSGWQWGKPSTATYVLKE